MGLISLICTAKENNKIKSSTNISAFTVISNNKFRFVFTFFNDNDIIFNFVFKSEQNPLNKRFDYRQYAFCNQYKSSKFCNGYLNEVGKKGKYLVDEQYGAKILYYCVLFSNWFDLDLLSENGIKTNKIAKIDLRYMHILTTFNVILVKIVVLIYVITNSLHFCL